MRVTKTPRRFPVFVLRLVIALGLFAATPSIKSCDALVAAPMSPMSMSIGGGGKTFTTTYNSRIKVERKSRRRELARKFLRRKEVDTADDGDGDADNLKFSYDVNEFVFDVDSGGPSRAYLLIHPIGVGIGRWYYDRLLSSLRERVAGTTASIFLAPDLLGSSTASAPVDSRGDGPRTYPLLNITDWSDQVCRLMDDYGRGLGDDDDEGRRIESWTLVTNGGCAPIALSAAARRPGLVSNVVISSPPRLPIFLQSSDPRAVRKAYSRLCGIVGRLFWWYSLKSEGRFIKSFSEKNLVGNPESLGPDWLPNCLESATLNGGQSRYSTFAFLAGCLQDGCVNSLNALKDSDVKIHFIRGSDKRRNRARSWFWRRNKKNDEAEREQTIAEYLRDKGNGGREVSVGGRISLAWEDPDRYAASLLELTI